MDSIATLRAKVDEINAQLLDLLSERARIVVQIGQQHSLLGKPHYDPAREEEMLRNLAKANRGPFP